MLRYLFFAFSSAATKIPAGTSAAVSTNLKEEVGQQDEDPKDLTI